MRISDWSSDVCSSDLLVLPVGGIKEKVVAAVRAGIKTVILPARNKRDLEEIPEHARNQVAFVWAENVDQVIDDAIGPQASDAETQRSSAWLPLNFPLGRLLLLSGLAVSRMAVPPTATETTRATRTTPIDT